MIRTRYGKLEFIFLLVSLSVIIFISLIYAASSAAGERSTVDIKLYGSKFGTGSYRVAFAFADIINKSDTWLRATAIETTGGADGMKTVAADKNLRKTAIFTFASPLYHDAALGTGAFKAPMECEILACWNQSTVAWITLNPKIKTIYDLAGKRVSVGRKGQIGKTYEKVLKAHVTPRLVEFLGQMPGKTALIDGRIDAAWEVFGDITMRPYAPFPAVQELLAHKGFRILGVDKKKLLGVQDEGYLMGYKELPKDLMRPGVPPEPVGVPSDFVLFGAFPELDDQIAYELVRLLYENAKKFAEYSADLRCVRREVLADIPMPPLKLVPAAEEFYKEKGLLK